MNTRTQQFANYLVKRARRFGRWAVRRVKALTRTKRQRRKLFVGSLILTILVLAISVVGFGVRASNQAELLNARQQKLLELNKALQNVSKQKASTEAELKAKAAAEADLKRQVDDLNKQLQAKRERQSLLARAAQAVSPPVYAAAGTVNCGDNTYKQFIYQHESGCSTTSTNANGCYGLGQDCNGVVYSQCGADWACQDAYFSNYAASRYGGWAQAYNFWAANGWW